MGHPRDRFPEELTLSQAEAETFEPESDNEVCISIRTHIGVPVRLSDRFRAVLVQGFADVEEDLAHTVEEEIRFSARHAGQILDFMDRHLDASRIVIHCHAGQSRWCAVAHALLEINGLLPTAGEISRWRGANDTVRRILWQEARRRGRVIPA